MRWAARLAQVYFDVLGDDVTKLQHDAVIKLIEITAAYFSHSAVPLVRIIFEKKLLILFSINSKKDMELFFKPSEPRNTGNELVPRTRFHIDEEELFMWMATSLKAPLNTMGTRRYLELLEKVFPGAMKLIL